MRYAILFIVLTKGIAQNYDWDNSKKIKGLRSPEKMENMIVWRLTDELDLTIDQAERFFPRFRKHRKILKEIAIQERGMIANIDRENLNKKDVKRMIEEISKLRQNRIELEAEFVLSLDDVLAPDQMFRLGIYRQKMMNEMREEIQGGKGKKRRFKKKERKLRNRGF